MTRIPHYLVCITLLLSPGLAHSADPPNLLLITVDTLRADRISPMGADVETPMAARLAKHGFLFTQALPTNTVTLPSHATIMTGRMPHEHHVHDNVGYRLGEDQVTLAETLAANGYATGAFVGAFVLHNRFGVAQGFSEYDDDFSAGFSSQRKTENTDRIGHCTQAWRLLDIPAGTVRIKLSVRHAAAGELGSFAYVLYGDDDGDGTPDRTIGTSSVYASEHGEWSWHIFEIPRPHPAGLYAGITWTPRDKKLISYARGMGTLHEWQGLEQRVWYAREAGEVPARKTDAPRASDLRIMFLNDGEEKIGEAGLIGRALDVVNGGKFWQGIAFKNFERRADVVVDRALAWLDTRPAPWFVWVHVFDPHMTYDPPAPYDTQYAGRPYDGEVAYADRQLYRLYQFLHERDLYDRTAIIYTADHGESLGEHSYWGHGNNLLEPNLHVPLIVKPARHREPIRVEDMVSLVSLAPTALALTGLEPDANMSRRSLLTSTIPGGQGIWALDPSALQDVTYSETYRYERPYKGGVMLGFRTEKWKLISIPRDENLRLYDLENDPGELSPEQGTVPPELTDAVTLTPQLLNEGEKFPGIESLNQEEIDMLRAAGYL